MSVFILALLTVFCALANGAHDLWAATAVYWTVLAAVTAVVARASLRKEPLSRDFLLALLAVAAAFAWSACRAGNPALAIFACTDWLAAAAVFWLSLQAFRSDQSVRLFTAMVAPLFWVELAVIVYQRCAALHDPGALEIWKLTSYSVPGTLVNSNVAAAFHLLWFPVLGRRALDERSAAGSHAAFWNASAVCCLLGIILLNSTSAMLCLLLGAPFIAGPKRLADWARRSPRLARTALACAMSAAAVLVVHKFMRRDPGPASEISRLGWWWTGLKMFRDHPWLGIGPGNYPSAFLAYKPGLMPNTLYAHSFPIELLAETGLAGFAGLLIFFSSWLARLRRCRDAAGARWPFLLGAVMILAYTTINIGFEYLVNPLGLAVFMGIAAAPAVESRWRPTRLLAALTATVCLTAAAYAAVPFLSSRALVAGDEFLKGGDVASALKNYEAAVQLYPLSAEARQGRARALYVRSRLTGSREDLQEAAAEEERAIPLDKLNASLRGELDVYRNASAAAPR